MEHETEEALHGAEGHGTVDTMAGDAAHGADAAAGHAADAVGMPQLDVGIFPNLVFWLVIAMGVLYFVLVRVALPRLNTILAERSDAISNDVEQAQLLKQRASEAEAAYDKALADARAEAKRIGDEHKAEVDRELKTLMDKADAEIAARTEDSERRIAEIEESASQAVREVAQDTAEQIVARFLGGAEADSAAVREAIETRMKG